MADFFKSQMDYIFFIYGLGFFSLAAVCFLLIRTQDKKLRWLWLALFGLVHAANEWLDLFALTFGDNNSFKLLRVAVLTLSFLFLFEFGRASFNVVKNRKIFPFVYVFLLILLWTGWYLGQADGLNMAARYCLGFCGGCFVAFVFLIVAYQGEKEVKSWRVTASIVFILYASTQLVIAKSSFPIPPVLSQETFIRIFHFPIQLARAILAFVASFLLWSYWYLTWSVPQHVTFAKRRLTQRKIFLSILITSSALVLGGFFTNFLGYHNTLQDKDKLLAKIETAAAAVNPRRVENLTASSLDESQPDYLRLREQLMLIKKANKDLRFVYLMVFKKGNIVILADSEQKNSPDYSPPGQVYSEAHPLLKRNFFSDNSFIIGPYKDRWGEWISAFSPIKDLETHENVAIIGMDISYRLWLKEVFRNRSTGILVVFGFFIILVYGFVLVELSRSAAARFSQANKFLELMMNNIPNPIYYKDRQGAYLGCNDAFLEFFGRSKKDIIGKTAFDLMPKDIAKKLHEGDMALIKLPGVQVAESKMVHADGSVRDLIISKSSFTDSLGEVAGIVGVAIDITERRRAEVALKKYSDEISDLYNHAPCGYHSLDKDGVFQRINETELKWLGYSAEEVVGKKKFSDFLTSESLEIFKKNFPIFKERGWVKDLEFDLIHKDGTILSVLLSSTAIKNEKGEFVTSRTTLFDVTERKKAEEKYRTLVENLNVGVYRNTPGPQGSFIHINPAMVKIFGYDSVEELLKVHVADLYQDLNDRQAFVDEILKKGSVRNKELRLKKKDGTPIHVSVTTQAFFDKEGRIQWLDGVLEDITDQKKIQEALARSEERYRLLAENATDIIWTMDLEGRYSYVSPSVKQHFGYTPEEASHMTFGQSLTHDSAVVASEGLTQLFSKIRAGERPEGGRLELEFFRKDGATIWCDATYSPIYDQSGKFVSLMGVTRNITDRKKAEEALRLLATIVETSDDAIISKNLEGVITSWNKGAEKMYGYRAEEIIGRSLVSLIPEDRPDEILKILEPIRQGRNIEHYETKRKRKDGVIIDISLTISPLKDKDDRIVGASTIGHDITESKRLQDQIFSEKERLSVTLSSIGDGVIATDIESRVILVNKAAEVLTGWKEEEALGRLSSEVFYIINEGTRKVCLDPFQEVLRTGNILELENHTVLIQKSGQERIIADSGAPIHDREGKIIGAVLVFRDITEQKKMFDDLKAAEKEWQRTFDAISDILFIQDKDFTIIKVNSSCLTALKLTSEQIIGKKCFEVLHRSGHPWPNCPFDQTRVDQKVHTEEVDDPVLGVTFLVTTSPIFKEDGSFYGSIHITKDISVIKKYQHELEKKNKDLEQLDQLKSDFISIVSHELRTPLAITKEGISLVLDGVTGKINVKQKKILKLSKDSMDRLARLINDLLDISKIESGRVQLLRKPTDLVKLAEKVLGNFTLKAREKKLKLALDAKTPEIVVNIDEDRIVQVFVNLVGNALKFTETGSIEVSLEDKGDEVKCIVADTGRGIAEKDLPKVFDKFMQFGRTAGGGEKGTGLGLSIAKGLIELHNGKMWVESELGKGTRFCFIIPRKTTMERVREHIDKAIGAAIKDSAEFSLVVAALGYSDKIRGERGESGLMELADQMEKVFRRRIYRQKDSVLNCLDKFFIILGDCNKPNSLIIRDRLEQELEVFLQSKNLSSDVKIEWKIATFPDDGNAYQALIEKVQQA